MAGDPYNREKDVRNNKYIKPACNKFFLSYRVFLLLIPILLILYIDSFMKVRHPQYQVKEVEFNTTEKHLIALREIKEEQLATFKASGLVTIGSDPEHNKTGIIVTCIRRRNYMVRKWGWSMEASTLELVNHHPGCVIDTPP
uniref:Uncharacterized protein n=1 Tax=Eucampia antarctica TaxID=49252 RepID=A0A7S2WNX2_9STRA|mmetsp:Transcript_7772/g.7347  ORF Transcript_7772/g.7347 Transcript_7772/m.7347 type:complete len:142 (+) Transcript_7772:3-428(+)